MVAYGQDLRKVTQLFHHERHKSAEGFYLERDGPPLYMNMPPVAGALFWVRGLLDRVTMPMTKLASGMSRVLEAEESQEVIKQHDGLVGTMRGYEEEAFTQASTMPPPSTMPLSTMPPPLSLALTPSQSFHKPTTPTPHLPPLPVVLAVGWRGRGDVRCEAPPAAPRARRLHPPPLRELRS